MNFSRRFLLSLAAAVSAFTQPTTSVTGILLDVATQAPLPGVHIQLHQNAAIPLVYGTDTDAQGRFAFQNIPAGTYSLIPRRNGMVVQRLNPDDPPVPTFNLKSGDAKEVHLGLTHKAIISGHVTDEAGIPLEEASILVEAAAGNQAALRFYTQFYQLGTQIRIDDHGGFRFTVPPGKYFVRAILRGMNGGAAATNSGVYTDTYFPSAPDSKTAQSVETQPGRETANINITLIKKRSLTISGLVRGADGGDGTMITLTSPSRRISRSNMIEQGGSFSLKNLEPETYVIHAEKIVGQNRLRSPAIEVKLTDRDVTDQILAIVEPLRLTGHIDGHDAGPVTKIRLSPSLIGNYMAAATAAVNTDGNFTFEKLTPERYTVAITSNSGTGYVKAVTLNSDPIADRSLDLRHVGTEAKATITLAAGAKIHGTISGPLGAIPSGLIILEPLDAKPLTERRRSGINEQSGYKFEAVPPGHYRLIVFDAREGNIPQLPEETDAAIQGRGEPLQVTGPGEIVKDVTLGSKTPTAEGKPK